MTAPNVEPLTAGRLLDLVAEFHRVHGEPQRTTVTVVDRGGWWLSGTDLLRVPRGTEIQYWIPRRALEQLAQTAGCTLTLPLPPTRWQTAQIVGLPLFAEAVLPRSFDGIPAELFTWNPYPRGMEP